jgi:hypothetical protein
MVSHMVFLTKLGFENLKKWLHNVIIIHFSLQPIPNFWGAQIQLEERNHNFLNSDVISGTYQTLPELPSFFWQN